MLRHEGCSRRLYACKAADATDRMAMIDKLLEYSQREHPGMELCTVLSWLDEHY